MTDPASLRPSRRFLLSLWASVAALGGCTSLIPGTGTPPQLYVLRKRIGFPPDLPPVRSQLLVGVPTAPAQIDTARIALSRSPLTLDYFADSAWADRAPAMVQSLLIEAFEETGRIPAVSRDSAALRADYLLMSELRRFEADYANPAGPPVAMVRMLVRLIRMPDRAIVGEAEFTHRETAARNDMAAIVAAFDDSLAAVDRSIVEWTLRRIATQGGAAAG